jgi:hypothetical protein
MCLYSLQKSPLKAERDIECYKILIVLEDKYITPYRDFIFELNKPIVEDNEKVSTEIFGLTEIGQGFFHAFTSKDRVIEEIEILRRKCPKGTKLKVFNAIIPKDSEYYVGQRSDICGTSLMVLE